MPQNEIVCVRRKSCLFESTGFVFSPLESALTDCDKADQELRIYSRNAQCDFKNDIIRICRHLSVSNTIIQNAQLSNSNTSLLHPATVYYT